MSEESPSVYKLPLEVMGLILLRLGNPSERRFEEIKKCKLISPRWHKAVQVLFQDQFFQKGLVHFDGLKHTYGQSIRFGFNVFGSFPVDFSTFKISNAETHLLNNMLAKLTSSNLQHLILQDNQLNLKELLEVLKQFPNIVKLEFIQSVTNMPRNMARRSGNIYDINLSNKICQLYGNPDDKSDAETLEIIKNELAGTENFLRNLKIISFSIIHSSIVNYIILIISCSQCELEELSIKFNVYGIVFSFDRSKPPVQEIQENENIFKKYQLGPMTLLNKFSKSLKRINITAKSHLMAPERHLLGPHKRAAEVGISRLVQSIFNIFNENQLKDLKNIEELKIHVRRGQFTQNESGLLDFIKSQNNLTKVVEVGVISELFGPRQENGAQLIKTHLESLSSLDVKFGYEIRNGLDPIIQYSENLNKFVVYICSTSNWRFSDHKVTFPNCESLKVTNACSSQVINNRWPNFEVPDIVKKFPNLKNLVITDLIWIFQNERPQVLNEDLQIIIKNYSNLEKLSISCASHLDDSGLTGLTLEALELRKNSSNLPFTPEERTGLPISHLKNLVELIIYKDIYSYHSDPLPQPYRSITDLTPMYGFENETPKLKLLYIWKNTFTASGIEILKKKVPSSCRLIVQPNRTF